MAWKGVHLTKAARLSFGRGQCCVKQDDGEARISIKDLAWVIIDTPQATLTSALWRHAWTPASPSCSPTRASRRRDSSFHSTAITGRA
jgi:hypothetical protein